MRVFYSIFLLLACFTAACHQVDRLGGLLTNRNIPPVSLAALTPEADFQARCSAPGVLRCVGFDSPSEMNHAVGSYDTGLYPAEDGTYQGYLDTSVKTSGGGSLRFDIRPGNVSPLGTNPAGFFRANFGPDNNITSFGPHSTLYFQFRLRLSPSMLNFDWTTVSATGWKVFIAYGPIPGVSCTGAQFVQENSYQNNVATGYTSCGSPGLQTNNGVPPYLLEQGDYNCAYGTNYASDPNCFAYPADTWMTEYWIVETGDYGQPNSHFTAYIAADGQPLKKFIDLPNFVFNAGADPKDTLQTILLDPYFSGATGLRTNPAGSMWFDELIISSQPIAAPGTSSGVPAPTATPAPVPAPTATPAPTPIPPVGASPTPTPVVNPPTASAILINAGGSSYTNASGQTWVADQFFSGGSANYTTHDIMGATDMGVYKTWRASGTTLRYTIPTLSGANSMTLKFSENNASKCGVGQRVFNVSINGVNVLSNFDIYAQAGACYTAVDKSFTVQADANNQIVIDLQAVAFNAMVNGIVVQPLGTQPPAPTPTPTPTPIPQPTPVPGSGSFSMGWTQLPNTAMISVCPNTYGPCGPVITSWASGVADTKRNRLVFTGGGHSDYAGNEVYALDLNARAMLRLTNPSPQVGFNVETNPDGNPASRHTYGGLAYIASVDKMYMHGGDVYGDGTNGASVATWTLDFPTLTWARKDPTNSFQCTSSGCNYQSFSAYDPNTDAVYVLDENNNFLKYTVQNNTYASIATAPYTGASFFLSAAIDEGRKIYVALGGGLVFQADISSGGPTQINEVHSSVSSSCSALLNAQYPGLAYDPVLKALVAWIGGDSVIVYNPATMSCSTITYSGGPGTAALNGVFGHFRYFPALGVYALVNDWQQNGYVLRIH